MINRIPIKEYTELHAKSYDMWHKRNSYYYDSLKHWYRFIVPCGSSVFELGMGDGSLVASLNPSRVSGIDISRTIVTKARERYPEWSWIEGDASKDLPIGQTYDYVIASDFFGYVEDIQGALEQVHNLCHERTRLVITKLNPFWNIPLRIAAFFGLAQPRMYANWLGVDQTVGLLSLADFEIIRTGKFLLFPLNIPIISVIINRYIARLPILWHLCAVEYIISRPRQHVQADAAPSVTVVIPARNESGNIRSALERMPIFPGKLEVQFVEGNSTDDTWKKIQEVANEEWPFTVTCLRQDGKGKGDAVRKGFIAAKGDLLIILDADLTVIPEVLPRFYTVLANRSADYVQGTRLVYPMEGEAMRPLNWIGNKFFGFILSVFVGQRFSDTLCGTKCLWRDQYLRLAEGRAYFGDFDPFGDFDLIFGSAKLNLKMQEVPIHYKKRIYGETNINRIRDGWLLIKMCWFAMKKMYFI
jgi:hypothetical protein